MIPQGKIFSYIHLYLCPSIWSWTFNLEYSVFSLRPQALGPSALGYRHPVGGSRPALSGLESQAWSLRPQVSGLQPQTSGLQPQISSIRPPAPDLQP